MLDAHFAFCCGPAFRLRYLSIGQIFTLCQILDYEGEDEFLRLCQEWGIIIQELIP